ncbi:hypothetical protein BC937DRAFT_95346 [Endogone sp. FLAS-F59071]|nr:hypothetical protein BC937DRAFT_95346 [Endogone sp. FLAS-F59071]|eukprot:RUS13433.1 hypothetical protein BC937DRAFT_95346 [Endogone sp. FLAS-F59071]
MSQIRRNTRLRREYLYRKSLETKERSIFERKQKIKEAIERRHLEPKGKPIPTELRREGEALKNDLHFDEAQAG